MRTAMIAATFALSMTVAPAAAQKAPGDPQEPALIAVLRLLQDGKAEEALTNIDPVLAAYESQYAGEKRQIYCPDSPALTLLYLTEAATKKHEAIAISPNWCEALFAKGFALDGLRRFGDAVAPLEKAVAMAPQNAHFLNELGYAYQQQKDWPKSMDAYERAADAAGLASPASINIEKGRAWRGTAYDLVELGKWDEAEARYRDCLKLDPNDTKSQGELHWIAEQRKKQSEKSQ